MAHKLTTKNGEIFYIPENSAELAAGYCNTNKYGRGEPSYQYFHPRILDAFHPVLKRPRHEPTLTTLGKWTAAQEGFTISAKGNITRVDPKLVKLPSIRFQGDERVSEFDTGRLHYFEESGSLWNYSDVVAYDNAKLLGLPREIHTEIYNEMARAKRSYNKPIYREINENWKYSRDYPIVVQHVTLVQQAMEGKDTDVRVLIQPDTDGSYAFPAHHITDHASLYLNGARSSLFVEPGTPPTLLAMWPEGLAHTPYNETRFRETLLKDQRVQTLFHNAPPNIKPVLGMQQSATPAFAFTTPPSKDDFIVTLPNNLTLAGRLDGKLFHCILPGNQHLDVANHRVIITISHLMVNVPIHAVPLDVAVRSNNPPVLMTLEELETVKKQTGVALFTEQAQARGHLPKITLSPKRDASPPSIGKRFGQALFETLTPIIKPIAALVDAASMAKRVPQTLVEVVGIGFSARSLAWGLQNSTSFAALETKLQPIPPDFNITEIAPPLPPPLPPSPSRNKRKSRRHDRKPR